MWHFSCNVAATGTTALTLACSTATGTTTARTATTTAGSALRTISLLPDILKWEYWRHRERTILSLFDKICTPLSFSIRKTKTENILMPKRYGRLYQKAFTVDALYEAFYIARKGKRKTMSVQAFESNLGANIQALHDELKNKTYKPMPYRHFWVTEPKPRKISAPAFRDVVVQHAIYALIYPIFNAGFVDQSHGCRKLKGIHSASDAAQRYLRQCADDQYVLQMDIRKFYYRIDRTILRQLIEHKIKDREMVELMMMLADHSEPTGVPIGNLLSQIYALIYLNPLDHFVKRELKAKRYVRYVDDFIIFGLSKKQAHEIKDTIEAWLNESLKLEFSKWHITPVSKGVNFVGFRTWRNTRFVRKHSIYQFSKSLRRGDIRSLNSIMGHAVRTATLAHYNRRIKRERPDLIPQLPLYKEVKNANVI